LTLVVLLGYVAYTVGTSGLRSRWRGLGAAGCAAAVCVVAYSRMYLDMHWLSDVLGGISGGLALLLLAIWTIGWMPPLRQMPEAARHGADLAGHRPLVETAAEILIPVSAEIASAPAAE
jgi:membrane-associated phospholipid phosphatase